MTSTIFSTGTLIASTWLNDVNSLVWTVFNGLSVTPAAGKVMRSNGTNVVPSTYTIPDTYTIGDFLQATLANTLTALPAVATGNALISGGVGVASSWGKIGLTTHITGTLAIANGGTGQITQTAAFNALSPNTTKGDVTIFDGTNNVRVGVGADGLYLGADSTSPQGVSWKGPNVTGVVSPYVGSTAPSGAVMADGKTIGDASSGGTERANADTLNLFTLLWNSMANTEAPVSGGRGASASADFAAHKTITLPDLRGRAIFGKDNMGGTTASRVTAGNSGIAGTTLGTAGGDERLHLHSHTITDPTHSHTLPFQVIGNGGASSGLAPSTGVWSVFQTTNSASTGITGTNNSGAGNSQNMPPATILNFIIWL